MDKIIKLKVSAQHLTGDEICSVNRTVGLMSCEFEFDDSWNDYPVRLANFKRDTDPMSEAVTRNIINGQCRVPDELLKYKGTISVAVQGENTEGQTERTEALRIIAQTQTIVDGRNVIDPSPDQYTDFIERAGEAIEEYFEEHKEEFKGDPGEPGEPGAPGDDYVLTQEDREEIAGIAVEEIQPALNKKMEYYAVTIENGHMTHNGEVQTYADILNAFNDQSVFLYLSYLNLIFIPSFVVAGHEEEGRDAVEFASAYYYAEEPTIARVIINSAEQIKYDQIALENTDWKVDDLTGWTIGEYPQAYPTADAVATQFDSVKESISELDNTKVGYSEVVNGQLLMYSDDSKAHLLATMDLPMPNVDDVQINGASVVSDGVANIPIASPTVAGVVTPYANGFTTSNNKLYIKDASNGDINERRYNIAITGASLDYAIKRAMCDGKGAEWTETEKANARKRIGEPQFELIEEITLTEDVASIERTAEPNGNPYNFKKLLIAVRSQSKQTTNTFIVFNVNEYSEGDSPYITHVANNGLFCVAKFNVSDGIYEHSIKGGNNPTAQASVNSRTYGNSWLILANTINSCRVYVSGTGKILANTNIRIYGIRA